MSRIYYTILYKHSVVQNTGSHEYIILYATKTRLFTILEVTNILHCTLQKLCCSKHWKSRIYYIIRYTNSVVQNTGSHEYVILYATKTRLLKTLDVTNILYYTPQKLACSKQWKSRIRYIIRYKNSVVKNTGCHEYIILYATKTRLFKTLEVMNILQIRYKNSVLQNTTPLPSLK